MNVGSLKPSVSHAFSLFTNAVTYTCRLLVTKKVLTSGRLKDGVSVLGRTL